MAKDFFVILTETGRAKLANAVALGRTVSLTHCAVGDGAGQQVTPDAAQDALVRETYRAQLNTLEMDPDNPAYIVAELVIPSEQGGWTIREAGVFDADGDLFAVGNLPETYKPQIAEGSAAELRVRLVLEVSNTAAVELKVDPTVVLASRSYVNAQVVEVRALLETHTTRTDDPHHTIPEGGEPGQVLMRGADGALSWDSVAGVPVGQLCFSTTDKPLPGTVPVNVKQKFLLGTYPQLEKWVRESGAFLTSEADWDAEAEAQEGTCGKYCLTKSHLILPCYRHYFASAQDGVEGKGVGEWVGDAILDHNHDLYASSHRANLNSPVGNYLAYGSTDKFRSDCNVKMAGKAIQCANGAAVDHENRPKTSYLLPCIKVSDVAINAAQVDLSGVASHIGNMGDPHQTLPDGGEAGQVLMRQDDGSVSWGNVAGVPVGQLCWSSLGVPLPGTVPANVKQKFQRGLYPQLDEAVLAAGNYLTDEAAWDAEAAAQEGSCGRYCVTTDHILLPCVRHYVGAARPGEAGKDVGDWAGDAIRNITGSLPSRFQDPNPWLGGVFYNAGADGGYASSNTSVSKGIGLDASRVVPTADENRPKTLYALPCIKVADITVNAAQVDLIALADQVAAINGTVGDVKIRDVVVGTGVGTLNTPIPLPSGFPEDMCHFVWWVLGYETGSNDHKSVTGTTRTPTVDTNGYVVQDVKYMIIGVR
jgi:hypothetical protein